MAHAKEQEMTVAHSGSETNPHLMKEARGKEDSKGDMEMASVGWINLHL